LLDTSNTVTGTASPSAVKMRVIPTLRPTRPTLVDVVTYFLLPGYDWPD
jgi:hypothetical protein